MFAALSQEDYLHDDIHLKDLFSRKELSMLLYFVHAASGAEPLGVAAATATGSASSARLLQARRG